MSESVDMVDFNILKRAGFNYRNLDLTGAGWCMCLPRDGGYLPLPVAEPDTWAPDPIPFNLEQDHSKILLAHSRLANQGADLRMGMDEVDNHA